VTELAIALLALVGVALAVRAARRDADRRLAESSAAHDRRAASLEAQLAASEAQGARLEAVIGAMGEGVLVVGEDGRVLLANPRLREIFAAPAALEGRSLLEAVRDAQIVQAIEGVLEGDDAKVLEVEVGVAPARHLRFSVAPYPAAERRAGAVAVFRDVTELRRSESARRDFVANASHELKTPLTAIRGFAERLADAELPDAASKQAVETILGNARRLGAIVEDLLELSRIESGSVPLRAEPVTLADLAARMLRDLDPRLRAGELRARVEAGAERAHCDKRGLEHVLGNLLDNAIKYTPPGGEIVLRAQAIAPGRVRIEVEDSGPGIPRKDLPRIFERFYRVDPGRSRQLGGTGLGLSIAKHWVQAMGGEIGVESQLGHGSRFWVELPSA
jgi:two-component system phosphate regulon sensor histidine kinase PhoR